MIRLVISCNRYSSNYIFPYPPCVQVNHSKPGCFRLHVTAVWMNYVASTQSTSLSWRQGVMMKSFHRLQLCLIQVLFQKMWRSDTTCNSVCNAPFSLYHRNFAQLSFCATH